ncbi:FkbM family methyltransferase [Helicobacter sp.]|uniref:FkbM family methyltransferase n=1 Tax=Helicobacter sp. TaxID=218 RepID=UPI0025C3EA18|nr:FkbM family methyltransferase [Helicobacter sp.]MCI5968560.1 FkbM family methyltransferase [Helicobacter sp.]MDY2584770.1 FkbM family methyltransferase [Helicobacter sp.]
MNQDVVTLNLEDEKVSYKMCLNEDYKNLIGKTGVPYEYEILKDMISRIPKGSLVLDIGMHIGNHSLFLAANGFKVIAFEANGKYASYAKASMQLNDFDKKVTIYDFGLSNKNETLFCQENGITLFDGQETQPGCIQVNCKTLDGLNIKEKVALIKIDVEGMEHKVIGGGAKLIEKNRPIIYLEGNTFPELSRSSRILEKMNYVCWDSFDEAPTHLFLPLEMVSEREMLVRCMTKLALNHVGNSPVKQNTWANFAFDEIYKAIFEIKSLIGSGR